MHEIRRRGRVSQPPGRPLRVSTAWSIALSDSALPVDDVERDTLRRRLQPRADHRRCFVHPGAFARLARERRMLVLTGRAAAAGRGLQVDGDDDRFDAYVRASDFGRLRREGAVDLSTAVVNAHVHVVDDGEWPFEATNELAPLKAVWLDLSDDGDRAESLVLDALADRGVR